MCMVVPISYVDSESTIREIDINLNVPDDIDDESVNDDRNINAFSTGNQIRRIVIHNNPRPHMSLIDPDAAHIAEFRKYPETLPTHRLAVDFNHEELLIEQRFESKEECVFAIKRYNMNISVNYKVEMWEIRKIFGPHTCISTRMTKDHRKLDFQTICTCIMPMVKDMPTIEVLILIAEIQARFQYRVSYQKAWIAKQTVGYLDANIESATSQPNGDDNDAMVANRQMARLMNVEVYSQYLEKF
ncbi:hypothetical protein GOBAR_DD18700 [Gossypium barbadense]|nr:hypothetical protein GOBAR_DD18700 [Gossypium barbadense]